ncbi:MAG: hypothetical protein IPK28_22625 [Devosia sp.]|nr:hypothetical protein [Devosia sp.]
MPSDPLDIAGAKTDAEAGADEGDRRLEAAALGNDPLPQGARTVPVLHSRISARAEHEAHRARQHLPLLRCKVGQSCNSVQFKGLGHDEDVGIIHQRHLQQARAGTVEGGGGDQTYGHPPRIEHLDHVGGRALVNVKGQFRHRCLHLMEGGRQQ